MPTQDDTRSRALFEKACRVFPGGVNSPVRAFKAVGRSPFVVARAAGPHLYDVDGNRYIDYVCSWGPLVLGHCPGAVTEAVAAQAARGTSYGACCEQELELALLIREQMPDLEMLRFVNSGTEAGMTAVRLARGFTGRTKIVKFSGCYHGHSDALLAAAGSGVATLALPECAGVPPACVADTLIAEFNDLAAVESLFGRFPEEIAAVIVEPAVGNAGLSRPTHGFLQGLRAVSAAHRSLLIFDEVMTGFRVHLGGAQALFGVAPDLTMLGKVIGGGLPVAAVGGRGEIMERLAPAGPVYQAGTLSGNPLAMAAGAATLREWIRPGVFARTAENAERLARAFEELAARHSLPLSAQALGTMFGLFFRAGCPGSYSEARDYEREMFVRFFTLALERGIFFPPSPFEACFMSAAHEGQALDETLAALREIGGELSR